MVELIAERVPSNIKVQLDISDENNLTLKEEVGQISVIIKDETSST